MSFKAQPASDPDGLNRILVGGTSLNGNFMHPKPVLKVFRSGGAPSARGWPDFDDPRMR